MVREGFLGEGKNWGEVSRAKDLEGGKQEVSGGGDEAGAAGISEAMQGAVQGAHVTLDPMGDMSHLE